MRYQSLVHTDGETPRQYKFWKEFVEDHRDINIPDTMFAVGNPTAPRIKCGTVRLMGLTGTIYLQESVSHRTFFVNINEVGLYTSWSIYGKLMFASVGRFTFPDKRQTLYKYLRSMRRAVRHTTTGTNTKNIGFDITGANCRGFHASLIDFLLRNHLYLRRVDNVFVIPEEDFEYLQEMVFVSYGPLNNTVNYVETRHTALKRVRDIHKRTGTFNHVRISYISSTEPNIGLPSPKDHSRIMMNDLDYSSDNFGEDYRFLNPASFPVPYILHGVPVTVYVHNGHSKFTSFVISECEGANEVPFRSSIDDLLDEVPELEFIKNYRATYRHEQHTLEFVSDPIHVESKSTKWLQEHSTKEWDIIQVNRHGAYTPSLYYSLSDEDTVLYKVMS